MVIIISLDKKVIKIIYTTLDKQTLVKNWYVIKRMANVEDLEIINGQV